MNESNRMRLPYNAVQINLIHTNFECLTAIPI